MFRRARYQLTVLFLFLFHSRVGQSSSWPSSEQKNGNSVGCERSEERRPRCVGTTRANRSRILQQQRAATPHLGWRFARPQIGDGPRQTRSRRRSRTKTQRESAQHEQINNIWFVFTPAMRLFQFSFWEVFCDAVLLA